MLHDNLEGWNGGGGGGSRGEDITLSVISQSQKDKYSLT